MSLSLFHDTTKHELTHPITKEPTGLVLELLPPDHDDVYDASINVVKSLRTKGVQTALDVAVSLENRIKVAAACIVGWEVKTEEWIDAIKKLGFEDASFSPEKVLKLLSMKTA